MEVLGEIHAANMPNRSTNAGMQHRAENNHQDAAVHLRSESEKTGIVLKAGSLQAVCLPPVDSELCRRSLWDLSPASEEQ